MSVNLREQREALPTKERDNQMRNKAIALATAQNCPQDFIQYLRTCPTHILLLRLSSLTNINQY